MKRTAFIILLICCVCILSLESRADALPDKEIVEINEKFFIQQCDDVYLNPDYYEDKLIKIEGLCAIWDENGETRYRVYRTTPGCCGFDGESGFRFLYNGKEKLSAKDWISLTASVKLGTSDFGFRTVVLDALELSIKAERGAEFVRN